MKRTLEDLSNKLMKGKDAVNHPCFSVHIHSLYATFTVLLVQENFNLILRKLKLYDRFHRHSNRISLPGDGSPGGGGGQDDDADKMTALNLETPRIRTSMTISISSYKSLVTLVLGTGMFFCHSLRTKSVKLYILNCSLVYVRLPRRPVK